MCLITAAAVSAATGIALGASAVGASGIGAAGVIAGIANVALAAGAIAGIGSSAMGAINSYQQGKAQQEQYNYEARVAQENARIAQSNADEERQQGIEEARLQRIKASQAIGSQKTAMAANGVDITEGTALDVIEDTAAMGELDALQTRYNYERRALAYEQNANNLQNQSNLDILAGQNAYSAGKMNGLAHGLEGIQKAGSVASKWFDFGSGSSAKTNSISWGKAASGMKIGTQGDTVYAPYSYGLG